MSTLKRYDNLFIRELVRFKFKIHSRENNVKNLISFSNNDNDYFFMTRFRYYLLYKIENALLNKLRVIKFFICFN